MPIPTLSTPPTTPQRLTDTPADFVTHMDAWLTYEAGLSAELNAFGTAVAATVSGIDFNGTSATSVTIGTGSKSFTANTGKLWNAGQFVNVASDAAEANYMWGQVTSYNSGTGALVVNVSGTGGSGTYTDWVISIAPSASGYATLAGSETLTNKTISLTSNTLSGTIAQFNTACSDADFATLAGSETLTNKTVNLTSNTLTGTIAQFNTACSDADFATLAGSETLTTKTINLTSNTLTGTIAQFNTACSDADFATIAGSETLTNKTLTTPALTDPVITGCILEDIYTISDGAAFEIDPGNGSIQKITLGASRTPKGTNFSNGESITLLVDDGTAYTLTWTDTTFGASGVKWIGSASGGGSAPTLGTTGLTWIVLTKYNSQVYGMLAGYSS